MSGKYHANSEFSKVQVFTTKISITLPILVGWGHGCIHICGNKPLLSNTTFYTNSSSIKMSTKIEYVSRLLEYEFKTHNYLMRMIYIN